jgi:UDP-N-acetylmuramate dehydrogenase
MVDDRRLDFDRRLREIFGDGRVGRNVPLARFTTFRIGGPADWLVEPRSAGEIVSALGAARDAKVPVTVIGGGSNLLVGDRGVRGLVLRPRGGTIQAVDRACVRAEAPVTMNGLVRWTISHGFQGLEAWAGTPGTVGGAVAGNAHYGGRLIGELVRAVVLAAPDGAVAEVRHGEMDFGYDRSRIQHTGDVLLAADFHLVPGADPGALRVVARRSLAHRKGTQPLDAPSAGCTFRNPSTEEWVPEGVPRSAGALIDRAGLKGYRVGGARVSPVHANFIVNDGQATAADVRALASLCRQAVLERFGILLREEIVYLGEF